MLWMRKGGGVTASSFSHYQKFKKLQILTIVEYLNGILGFPSDFWRFCLRTRLSILDLCYGFVFASNLTLVVSSSSYWFCPFVSVDWTRESDDRILNVQELGVSVIWMLWDKHCTNWSFPLRISSFFVQWRMLRVRKMGKTSRRQISIAQEIRNLDWFHVLHVTKSFKSEILKGV